MNLKLLLILFYLLTVIKFNISSVVFGALLGSSYLLNIVGLVYKLLFAILDKEKIDDKKPIRLNILLAEICKNVLIITVFELLPPGVGVTILFMLHFVKNVYKLIHNNYDLFNSLHYFYLLAIQFCLYLITLYSLPVSNINSVKNFLKLKEFLPLSIFMGLVSSDYIIHSAHEKESSHKNISKPTLGIRYTKNQIIAYIICLVYCIYKESFNRRLITSLKFNKYLKQIPIPLSVLYMCCIALLYHIIMDVLSYVSSKLDAATRRENRSYLSATVSPMDNRLVLTKAHIKLNSISDMTHDVLFLPSVSLLLVQLVNDFLIVNLYEN